MVKFLDAKEAREGQFQSWQQRSRNDVSGFGAQLDRPREPLLGAPVDPHHVEVRIHDPVLRHAGALVEVTLDGFVAASRAWRPDFDHQLRSALDVGRGQDLRRAFVGQVEQVRLDDVESRELSAGQSIATSPGSRDCAICHVAVACDHGCRCGSVWDDHRWSTWRSHLAAARVAHGRTMQRKPTWHVEVSIGSGNRAAGR